jgi:hypothetical protein
MPECQLHGTHIPNGLHMARTRVPATLALAALLLLTGCDAAPSPSTAGTTGPAAGTSLPPLSAADAEVCGAVRTATNDATAAYTTQVQRWVTTDDDTARAGALDAARKVFKDWAATLRAQAARAGEPRVAVAVTEYAGAVEAVIATVKVPGDLERLENLDGTEIDVAASRLAGVCP